MGEDRQPLADPLSQGCAQFRPPLDLRDDEDCGARLNDSIQRRRSTVHPEITEAVDAAVVFLSRIEQTAVLSDDLARSFCAEHVADRSTISNFHCDGFPCQSEDFDSRPFPSFPFFSSTKEKSPVSILSSDDPDRKDEDALAQYLILYGLCFVDKKTIQQRKDDLTGPPSGGGSAEERSGEKAKAGTVSVSRNNEQRW
ncbi:MAG: hypothetical protein GXP25_03390 [Planctomycetes bacterium]|nr:hypothetical protein [Planctomycetota bacterium]